MSRQTYSRGYEDNREFLVCFDETSEFGLIKHLYYEFPVPMRETARVIGNFVFSRIEFHSIYHYLHAKDLLRDKMHNLLIDGDRLFKDDTAEIVVPNFNIDIGRDRRRFSLETPNDPSIFDPGEAVIGILGVELKDIPVGSIEIHKPYTFTAKNVLFIA